MVLGLETETSFRAWTDSDELTSTDLASSRDPVRVRSNNNTTQYGERAGGEPKLGVLDVRGIEKSFAGRPILTNVSLHVQRNEVVILFGPSGAGKSTLFHIVTGLIPADAGQIELDRQKISHLPMYRRARLGLAYVPQEPPMKAEPAKLDALLTLIQLASQRGIGVLVAHQLNQHARRIRDVSDRAYLISGGQILGTLHG
jgi:ABC-type lipopolysaccharide export system ATPase subunit